MYKCTRCGHTMSYPQSTCPGCGVLLSGVRCDGCGYTDSKEAFINNNHRCPKCGSVVYQGGGISSYGSSSGTSYSSSDNNTTAVWSMWLGIVSLFCLGPLTGIPAIICGHIARKQIRETAQDGNGMALAGLILGYISLVLFIGLVITGILAPEV